MRFPTMGAPRSPLRDAGTIALVASAFAACLSLAGCGDSKVVQGEPGFVDGFFGAVVADEPRAAEAGRDILTGGGNAADAAVAMFFTLAATLPSSASLGAGGVCLVSNPVKRQIEAIVFPAASAGGGGISVLPVIRGMGLLHARHGQMPWERLVASGERLARFGTPVARALSRDLQTGARLVGVDAEARRIYDRGGGVAITEGDVFRQFDLGATLGSIKLRGAGEFYQGPFARQLVDAVQQAGASLSIEEHRKVVPRTVDPLRARFGSHVALFAPSPFVGGQAAAAAFEGQPAPVAASSDPASRGEAGFVAVDRRGGAVACNTGMNQLFGARKVAGGTGIMLGAADGDSNAVMGPMLVVNANNFEFLLAAAGSGGPNAPASMGTVARQVLGDRVALDAALRAQPAGARLSMVACPGGLRENRSSCQVATDPRGHGLALAAER